MEEVISRLVPRIAGIMEGLGFDKLGYNLDEEKFVEYEINDPFVERFLFNFAELFLQYKVIII